MEAETAETVRRGELSPAALVVIAPELAINEEGMEALYDGLRVSVADLLRSGGAPEEANEWCETLTHLIGIADDVYEENDSPSAQLLATRLDTLRDLSADARAYQALYSVDRLGEFPTYRDLLLLTEKSGGTTSRKNIVTTLGLKQGNGTRILILLENARLLRRRKVGGEVQVSITGEGRRRLAEWASDAAATEGPRQDNVAYLPRLHISGGPIHGVPDAERGYEATRVAIRA